MLHSIHIKNWKGHDEISLSFEKGANFLIGPNGIGKTSILDAICFALLGTIEFIGSYRGISFRNLIRDSSKDSEISLSFSISDGQHYEIIRRAGATRRATLKRDGRLIASRWQEVTDKVVDLYKASEFFFGRVIFLSEGDTYEYINSPPGEDLASHIEKVLGIDRMESVENTFSELNRKYRELSRNLRGQIESASLSSDADKERLQKLTENMESLEQERTTISRSITQLSKEQNTLSSQIEMLQKALDEIHAVKNEWQQYFTPLTKKQDPIQVMEDLRARIEREYKNMSEKRDRLAKDIGRISALIDSQQRIMEIIQPLSQEPTIERVCPICKRPLTEHMIGQIGRECSQSIASLTVELEKLNKQAEEVEKIVYTNQNKAKTLAKLSSEIRHLIEDGPGTISPSVVTKKIHSLQDSMASLIQKLNELQERGSQVYSLLVNARVEQEDIQKKVDPDRINTMRNSLLSSTRTELFTEIFIAALEDSLAEQRKIMLSPLTQELSKMWTRFLNRPVKVEMGDNLELKIVDKQYVEPFKFPQLSGGEKTALLILTQILLCKHFSESDFMLIDEPLEHLDSRNRWSLINFLVESCKHNFPGQLIVTTIEESFLREYLGDPSVQVISLG